MVLLNRRDVSGWVDAVLGSHSAGIVRNLVIVGAFASMQLFYLRNIARYRPRHRRYGEVAALAVTVAVILVAPLFVDPPFNLQFTSRDIQHPAVLVFFLTASAYLVYACITQIVWSSRDSVPLYRERAWDFLVVAVSLTIGCGIYLMLFSARISYYAQVLFGSSPVSINMWIGGLVLIRISVLSMLLAVFYPAAVADLRRVMHRASQTHAYVRLRSLDSVIRSVYPELVRPASPDGDGRTSPAAPSWLPSWPSRLSCELREQRCSDGYARMYNVFAGYSSDQRPAVAVAVDGLRQMPGDLPERASTGQTRPLMEISGWLRKHRVPQMMSKAPNSNVG
ncbi:hypothetical protein [Pseudonocardia saturnea]|uniref:Uncharacterized protein n=2 Tax=Pseudonocardia TaxID=1847 RepID=A0A1Y2MJ01_PSEAH|nr:hypothetical protein [Pseudonocardia saturnea]OSY35051.1 hypothetical protein BG845_06364 [Pseudonocardia autotrophica]TDN65582.1 hypothetical protein C8E95_7088 [Pseudonocardia autotrophica]